MDEFADFIRNMWPRTDFQRGVKVALIDDGVDLLQPALENSVKKGSSFTSQHHSLETKPYYFSSTGHGTLMAKMIRRICPAADLYVARIEVQSATGEPIITSAAKVNTGCISIVVPTSDYRPGN